MTLAAPNARFLYSITDMANVILPEHILKDVTAADVEKIDFTVGKPGRHDRDRTRTSSPRSPPTSRSSSRRFPDYFKGAPKIEKIVFKLFADPALAVAQLESGDLDLAFRVSPGEFDRLSAIADPERDLGGEPGHRPDRVQDRGRALERQARAPGVLLRDQPKGDRRRLLQGPGQGPVSTRPGSPTYADLNKYDYNVDTAQAAPRRRRLQGETFKLLYNQTFPDARRSCRSSRATCRRPGSTVELVPTDNETYLGQVQRPDASGTASSPSAAARACRPTVPRSTSPARTAEVRVGLHEPADLRALGAGSGHGRRGQAGRGLPRAGQDPQRGRCRRPTSIRRTS